MSSANTQSGPHSATSNTVTLPAPTAWPIVLAFGITLVMAGLITSLSVMILGAILAVSAALAGSSMCFLTKRKCKFPLRRSK